MALAPVVLLLALFLAGCGADAAPSGGSTPTATPSSIGSTPVATPTAGGTAEPMDDGFFRGKTIRIIVGFTPGGGYDAYARLVARHLPKYIPGNPTVLVQNMPGGGGMTAANFIYSAARRDGTAMGLTLSQFYLAQFNREPGIDFNVLEMPSLGSAVSDNTVMFVRTEAVGDRTLQEWAADIASGAVRQPYFGATGLVSTIQEKIVAQLLPGFGFETVLGYPGQTEVFLAIRRGEIDASTGSESSFLAQVGDMFRAGDIRILNQTGTAEGERAPEYPDAPTLSELANTPFERALVSAFAAQSIAGRPFFLPPNVPENRIAILRQAMWETFHDPEFLEEAARSNRPVTPVPATVVQQLYEDIFAVPEDQADQIRAILSE